MSEVLQIPYDNLLLWTLSTRPALTGAEVQLSCVVSPGETLPSLIPPPRWAFSRWRSLEASTRTRGAEDAPGISRLRATSPPRPPRPPTPSAAPRALGSGTRSGVGLCRPPARRPHALRDVGQPHRGPIAQTPRPPGPIPSTHQARRRAMTARSAQPRSSGPAYSPRTRPP